MLRRGKGEDREEGGFVNSNRRDGGGAAETEAGRGRRRCGPDAQRRTRFGRN